MQASICHSSTISSYQELTRCFLLILFTLLGVNGSMADKHPPQVLCAPVHGTWDDMNHASWRRTKSLRTRFGFCHKIGIFTLFGEQVITAEWCFTFLGNSISGWSTCLTFPCTSNTRNIVVNCCILTLTAASIRSINFKHAFSMTHFLSNRALPFTGFIYVVCYLWSTWTSNRV